MYRTLDALIEFAMLRINVVTLFPEFFAGHVVAEHSGACESGGGRLNINFVELARLHARSSHRTVDDYAFGGGPGMVMKPQPFFEAVESIQAKAPIVLMSPRGKRFSHADAVRFSECEEITFLCGHYKDVDERVATHLATEEISLGDFVLSGGEPAALAIVDAIVRLLPGAMSDLESARGDSFFDRGISAPSYTRPPEYRGATVPAVLLSGDHKKIQEWRDAESLRRTREAEARDRAETVTREQGIAVREGRIAELEGAEQKRAEKRAKRKANKKRTE